MEIEESKRRALFHENALLAVCPELSVCYQDMLDNGRWEVDPETLQVMSERVSDC